MGKIKKIYETDEWLRPYKEAIDARHARITATRERFSVDGSLAKGINNTSITDSTARRRANGCSANGLRMPRESI